MTVPYAEEECLVAALRGDALPALAGVSVDRLLDLTKTGDGVQIFIGADNDLFNLTGCAMVTAPFSGANGEIMGAIGVIGPTRINYSRIIPIVDYTAQVVGRVIR